MTQMAAVIIFKCLSIYRAQYIFEREKNLNTVLSWTKNYSSEDQK